jgi:hypothetical protein
LRDESPEPIPDEKPNKKKKKVPPPDLGIAEFVKN